MKKKGELLTSENGIESGHNTKEEVKKSLHIIIERMDEIFKDFNWPFEERSASIRKINVKHTNRINCWARIIHYTHGNHIQLKINPTILDKLCNGYQIGLYIHEAAHLKVGSHPPEFWNTYIKIYKNLDTSKLEDTIGEFKEENVVEFIESDPIFSQIDHRIENLPHRKLKNLKRLNTLNKNKKKKLAKEAYRKIRYDQKCELIPVDSIDNNQKYESLEKALYNLRLVVKTDNNLNHYKCQPIELNSEKEKTRREKRIIRTYKTLDSILNSTCRVPVK